VTYFGEKDFTFNLNLYQLSVMSKPTTDQSSASQEFEEMKVTRFHWMMMGCCFNPQNSLKKAVKMHAVTGIILAVITLLIPPAIGGGAICSFKLSPSIFLGSVFPFTIRVILLLVYHTNLLTNIDRPEAIFKFIKVSSSYLASMAFCVPVYHFIKAVVTDYHGAVEVVPILVFGVFNLLVFISIEAGWSKMLSACIYIAVIGLLFLVFATPLAFALHAETTRVVYLLMMAKFIFLISSEVHFLGFYVIQLNVMCAKSVNLQIV